MDIRKLQRAIVDGLEDVKAHDIVIFNTEHLSPLFERVIIASGTSNRQTKALAASVRDSVKSRGMQVMRTEGEDNGEWIIVDCGAAVAHIMQPAIRTYYHLEEIWGDKPVRMKMDHSARPSASASISDDEPAPAHKAPARKTPPGKTAAPKATAPKAKATKTAAAKTTAAKTPAAKTPVRKAAARAAAGRESPRKAPARNAPAKKATAGKGAAKKAVSRTTGTKTAVRKAPAKRAATGRR
jgi:ribosome-associated protein